MLFEKKIISFVRSLLYTPISEGSEPFDAHKNGSLSRECFKCFHGPFIIKKFLASSIVSPASAGLSGSGPSPTLTTDAISAFFDRM